MSSSRHNALRFSGIHGETTKTAAAAVAMKNHFRDVRTTTHEFAPRSTGSLSTRTILLDSPNERQRQIITSVCVRRFQLVWSKDDYCPRSETEEIAIIIYSSFGPYRFQSM